jgi:hypothetical protein
MLSEQRDLVEQTTSLTSLANILVSPFENNNITATAGTITYVCKIYNFKYQV